MLQVVSIAPVVEKNRYDGTTSRIAEAVLGDETGCVTFTARNGRLRSACALRTPRSIALHDGLLTRVWNTFAML